MFMSRRKAKSIIKYSARRLKNILASMVDKPTSPDSVFAEGLLYLKTTKKPKYYLVDESHNIFDYKSVRNTLNKIQK